MDDTKTIWVVADTFALNHYPDQEALGWDVPFDLGFGVPWHPAAQPNYPYPTAGGWGEGHISNPRKSLGLRQPSSLQGPGA